VDGKLVNLPDDSLISEEDFNKLERSFKVERNDVLLAIVGATLGKAALVEDMEPFAVQRSLAILRPNPKIVKYQFLLYFLQSRLFQSFLWSNVAFSAQPGIYLGALANFWITTPPIDEQQRIIEVLDSATAKIDLSIKKMREAIEHLHEYRTALTSAAVTGKIDVRGKMQ